MQIPYIQLYLSIKSNLKNMLPFGFYPRLILANNARNAGKHGYVLQLKAPTGKFLINKKQLLLYCQEHAIDFIQFKDLKFRFYLTKFNFKPEMELKDKYQLLFKYTKQILADHKNGVFSHRCCNRQFCQKQNFDQHRNIFHSSIIYIE